MKQLSDLSHLWGYYRQATRSLRFAETKQGMGVEFGYFGRKIGRKLLFKYPKQAIRLQLNPVSIVRYFEFPFVLHAMQQQAIQNWECLDVSSPYLFSLYLAPKVQSITMINPDHHDLATTQQTIHTLGIDNIHTQVKAVHEIASSGSKYNCIYSISVIEHISGEYSDSEAIRYMFDALKPNGILILTFPVAPTFEEEYRNVDHYGTQSQSDDRYFFQRFYDLDAIHSRLLQPLGITPIQWTWFGEKKAGTFDHYTQDWLDRGYACIVDDPRYIATQYQIYPSWETMPGKGVCGIVLKKEAFV